MPWNEVEAYLDSAILFKFQSIWTESRSVSAQWASGRFACGPRGAAKPFQCLLENVCGLEGCLCIGPSFFDSVCMNCQKVLSCSPSNLIAIERKGAVSWQD